MKTLTLSILALAAISTSFAQVKGMGGMQHHKMTQHHMTMPSSMMMETMMMGLSSSEKQTAMIHWHKMSEAERAVMMKRGTMCMHDAHKNMPKHMDEKASMAHMMSGLSPSEQMTMRRMMMKMSPAEMAVGKKIMMNCCMYGMKHTH